MTARIEPLATGPRVPDHWELIDGEELTMAGIGHGFEGTVGWRLAHPDPWFDNQVAGLELDGRQAAFTLDKAVPDDSDPRLERVFDRAL